MSDYTRVVLEIDQPWTFFSRRPTSRYRVSVSALDGLGVGRGYRISGPKYGSVEPRHQQVIELTRRDADEIRRHLDEVFPREGER